MKWFTEDARGNRTRTLPFVAVSWAAVVVKFLVGGAALGPLGEMPVIGAGEFGAAVAAILAIWIGREWKQKEVERGDR